ncbi:hypothetical protein B0680_07525 [Moraxella pluranimalium]|uniref:Uncharacterized protein n=1 Tax=Moraxella pluranimalium TaxID=470453 RepID=A0A1T0CLX3_9GAMM|nr:hypothetical protein B0680_07525 [Moraxella pluranimalium]
MLSLWLATCFVYFIFISPNCRDDFGLFFIVLFLHHDKQLSDNTPPKSKMQFCSKPKASAEVGLSVFLTKKIGSSWGHD